MKSYGSRTAQNLSPPYRPDIFLLVEYLGSVKTFNPLFMQTQDGASEQQSAGRQGSCSTEAYILYTCIGSEH